MSKQTPGERVAAIIEKHLAGLSEQEYDRILLQVERLMRERAAMINHGVREDGSCPRCDGPMIAPRSRS